MSLSEEDFNWHNQNLSNALSPNNLLRNTATEEIINRIKNEQNYIIVILNYCLAISPDEKNFKLSLIIIGKIIRDTPSFFLANFQDFQPLFFQLLYAVSNEGGSYIQHILGNVINLSLKAISSLLPEEDRNETTPFYDEIFNFSLENISTIPLCFYMRSYVYKSPNFDNIVLMLICYKIITEYYPRENDFELLKKCLMFFSEYTSKSSELDEKLDDIFQAIYDIAIKSNELKQDYFDFFWCSIQSLNINKSAPFVELAFELLKSVDESYSKLCLIRFIEEHVALVQPEQIETIITSFFNAIYKQEYLNSADFTIISSLSVIEFNTFGFTYDIMKMILSNDSEFDYLVYLLTISSLSESYEDDIKNFLTEIIDNCYQIFRISMEKNFYRVLPIVLDVLSNFLRIYTYDDKAKEIPYFLIQFIQPDTDQDFVQQILNSISCWDSEINKQEFFDKLLELFVSQHQSFSTTTLAYFFYVLSCYLPNAPLFPESKYQIIQTIVEHYSPLLDQKEDNFRFLFSIFLFKMYIFDQNFYGKYLEASIINLSLAISNINDNYMLDITSSIIIQYIKLFKEEALEFFRNQHYYTNLYNALFPSENPEIHPYMKILAYILKYDKNNFQERGLFYKYIIKKVFQLNNLNFDKAIEYANKFIYLTRGEDHLAQVLKSLKTIIFTLIESKDVIKLTYFISILDSFIKPSHVKRRSEMIDDDNYESDILPAFVEEMANIAARLMSICSLSRKNFELFICSLLNSIFSLSNYKCDIVHEFYREFSNQLSSSSNEEPTEMIIQNIGYFLDTANIMIDKEIINEEEVQILVDVYRTVLTNSELSDLYADIYASASHLALINAEPIMGLMDILYEHWGKLEDEYLLSILGPLFLQIFIKMSDQFKQEDIIEITCLICDRFRPFIQNCDFYLKSSLEFLTNFPDVPVELKERFLKNFITYLSYQKYCYFVLKVKEDTHQRLLEFLQNLIPELERSQEIIESCFQESPQALFGTLEMIGITCEEQPQQ